MATTEFKVVVSAKTMEDLRRKLELTFNELCGGQTVSIEAAQAKVETKRKRAGRPAGSKNKKSTRKTKKKSEPEVEEKAEPANKFIMDKFDQEQKEELGEDTEADALDALDNLLEEEEEEPAKVEPKAEGSAKAPTKEAVGEAATELYFARGKDKEVVKAVLAKYNVSKIGELKPSYYSAFIQTCKSMM